jgi:hypothetical protein
MTTESVWIASQRRDGTKLAWHVRIRGKSQFIGASIIKPNLFIHPSVRLSITWVTLTIYLSMYLCLSIHGSTALCWTLAAFSVSWSFIQSIEHLFGDQLSQGRFLHIGQHKENKRTQTSVPWVRFEPIILMFERAKIVHALDCAAHRSLTDIKWYKFCSTDYCGIFFEEHALWGHPVWAH